MVRYCVYARVISSGICSILTTRVVAGSQEDTSSSLAKTDNMASSGSRKDTVLADDELLDAVCSTNLGNKLDNLGVPVATVATDDEIRAYQWVRSWFVLCCIVKQECMHTLNTFRDGQQNAGDEGLAVVRLLEDGDLLSKTRAIESGQYSFQ